MLEVTDDRSTPAPRANRLSLRRLCDDTLLALGAIGPRARATLLRLAALQIVQLAALLTLILHWTDLAMLAGGGPPRPTAGAIVGVAAALVLWVVVPRIGHGQVRVALRVRRDVTTTLAGVSATLTPGRRLMPDIGARLHAAGDAPYSVAGFVAAMLAVLQALAFGAVALGVLASASPLLCAGALGVLATMWWSASRSAAGWLALRLARREPERRAAGLLNTLLDVQGAPETYTAHRGRVVRAALADLGADGEAAIEAWLRRELQAKRAAQFVAAGIGVAALVIVHVLGDGGALGPAQLAALALLLVQGGALTRALTQLSEHVVPCAEVERLRREEAGGSVRPVAVEWLPAIALDDVCFAYPGGPVVIGPVTLTVPAGATVALVGTSGCGKTTALLLAGGLLGPSAGSVRYGGVDVRVGVEPSAVQVLQQDPVRPPLSIGASACMNASGDTRREKLVNAAAELGLDALVDELGGWDTLLAAGFSKGRGISGGQWFLLALLRLAVSDARVVLLDEPAKSLDPTTHGRILAALPGVLAGRTAIVATHNHDIADQADLVAVLDRGVVVEQGRPGELLEHDGPYARWHADAVGGREGICSPEAAPC